MPLPPAFSRLPLLLMGMIALVSGVLAGLARLAVAVPPFAASQAGNHGALMISGFLGTVISLERAVALLGGNDKGGTGSGSLWPFLGPLTAGLGALTLLAALPVAIAHAFFIAASLTLAIASSLLFFRHPATHLATLALGATVWFGGVLVWVFTASLPAAVPWWIAFLVLTIAGERLELTRFLPIRPRARQLFNGIVVMFCAAVLLGLWLPESGLTFLAAACVALALWLLHQDIARRTVRQDGLTRYIAVCLLSGYVWLAGGGFIGLAGGFVAGSPLRDAGLHAIFLGFVFSMIFGHAPIIFPAVAKVKIPYHPVLYLPLALLHLTVALRMAGDLVGSPVLGRAAAIGNALTLLLFVFTVLSRVFFGQGKKS